MIAHSFSKTGIDIMQFIIISEFSKTPCSHMRAAISGPSDKVCRMGGFVEAPETLSQFCPNYDTYWSTVECCSSYHQARISWGVPGVPKVSLEPSLSYHFTPCVSGVAGSRVQSLRLSYYPHVYLMPCGSALSHAWFTSGMNQQRNLKVSLFLSILVEAMIRQTLNG
jgi:hypothetical protein